MGILERYFKDERGLEVLCKGEDAFAAYYVDRNESRLHIQEMFVDETRRGQGFGLSLGRELEKIASDENCHLVSCCIDCGMKSPSEINRLLFLYIKFGFLVVGAVDNKINLMKNLGG